jgi:hypothetical protein
MVTRATDPPSAFICQRVYTNTDNIDLPTGGTRRPPELPIKFVKFFLGGRQALQFVFFTECYQDDGIKILFHKWEMLQAWGK